MYIYSIHSDINSNDNDRGEADCKKKSIVLFFRKGFIFIFLSGVNESSK